MTSLFIWQLSQKRRNLSLTLSFPSPPIHHQVPQFTYGRKCISNPFTSFYRYAHVQSLSPVWLFAIPWTAACQAPLSMGFSRKEYWTGLPFSPPEDLPDPGIEPMSPVSLAFAGRANEPPGSTLYLCNFPLYSLASHLAATVILTAFSVSPMPYLNPFSLVKPDQALREKRKSDHVTLQVFVGWMQSQFSANTLKAPWEKKLTIVSLLLNAECCCSSVQVWWWWWFSH